MSTEMASKYPVNKKKTKGVRDSISISLQQTSDSGVIIQKFGRSEVGTEGNRNSSKWRMVGSRLPREMGNHQVDFFFVWGIRRMWEMRHLSTEYRGVLE